MPSDDPLTPSAALEQTQQSDEARKPATALGATATHDVSPSTDPAEPQDDDTPKAIGRFVVERKLGVGGFGTVLLARDPTLDRPVALKLLHHAFGRAEVARSRLLREAQAMAKLRHPNVVPVYEAGTHEGQVFLVLEYVAGGTLRARLDGAPLSVPTILSLFAGAGRGLAAAHAAGLVHRDFKPDNVLIDDGDIAKVTDFGLASRDDAVPAARAPSASDTDALALPLTQTGDILGTPRYMAPEQFEAKPADARSDQFAFCVALYEALYGARPFRGENLASLRASVLNDRPHVPSERTVVPARVTAAVLRGLSRDPAARFSSMDALIAELEPPARWRWPIVAAVITAAVVVTAIVAVAATRRGEAPATVAARAARACDCELLTLALPADARVVAIRQVVAAGVLPLTVAPAWQPTGQLAIPAGPHVIDYAVGDAMLSYAVVSRGPSAARTLELPPPEHRDGYVFVAGGEIEIGEPAATVMLDPYLIGIREHRDGVTYQAARDEAMLAHARLPTAAEWEWAARLAVLDRALSGGWEWTASQLVPYPYVADGRDDCLAPRSKSEVRGGGSTVEERRDGLHSGRADLRLARNASSAKPLSSVELELAQQVLDATNPNVTTTVIAPRDRARLDRFLTDWWQLDSHVPIQILHGGCEPANTVMAAGVSMRLVDNQEGEGGPRITVRWHPDPTYDLTREPGRKFTCTESREMLDMICFDGEKLAAVSESTVSSVATTLKGNPRIALLEIRAYTSGPNVVVRTQKRAELVRARLIALGVEPSRLVARGGGDGTVPARPEVADGLFEESATAAPPACPGDPQGRIVFEILKRT